MENPSTPLESANQSTPPERVPVVRAIPQKDPGLQLKKKKQTKQPLLTVEKKLASLTKLINKERKENAIQKMEVKKTKAKKTRNRKEQHIVAEITLNSSDEEELKPRSAKKYPAADVALSDDETDEVILIPTSPPPQICIDCSDEEEGPPIVQFAFPKSQKRKKKQSGAFASPRCLSPSNSSIMSDDFIAQHDRSRLNDSFTESIPNDDELECSIEGTARPGPSAKGNKKNAPVARQERVPSISSEDTICTSGETTDQEKRSLESDKGTASKTHPQQCNEANTTKSRKDIAATKKTPSKVKATKAVATTSIASPLSPCISKSNVNNKASATVSIPNDTGNITKTPVKSKTRSKSPLTLILEVARKHFEAKQTRDGTVKKTKSKKDGSVQKEPVPASTSKVTSDTAVDKLGECVEKEQVPSKGMTASKNKKKNNPTIPPVDDDDDVSSESDYDITLTTSKASTPQGSGKKSRRSASSFFEQIGDVSSESDYDEGSFLPEKKGNEKQKQAKETKKRLGRKRKQYNSETYSDEDFACLLTDIVRAVSDTEDEDDEEDDDDETTILGHESGSGSSAGTATSKKCKQNSMTEQLNTSSKATRNPKKKKKDNDPLLGTDGEVLPADKPSAVQPEVAVKKKKKKQKEPKSNVKKLAGSRCSTPEVQFISWDQEQQKSMNSTPSVQQSHVRKKKETQVNNTNADGQSKVQIIYDSEDDADDDIRIIDNSYSGRTSVGSGTSSNKAQTVGPDCAWNEEMKQFYNTSWADEDLKLNSILRQMPRDSNQWPILHKDRYPAPPKKEIICNICGERGHMKFKCRNKPKKAICYMCGEQGHKEPRCPKTICLNCGAKTRNFVRGCKSCARDADITCFSCGVRGHTQRSCTDLWRRYHSTIEDNVPLKKNVEKNPKARWCCICCRSGHQAHMCNDARRIFGHPIPNVNVSSYLPAYRGEYNRYSRHQIEEQQRRLTIDPTARYNLLSSDATECELNLPEMAQNENGFYYNFLRSTGLLERHERRLSQNLEEVDDQQEEAPSAPPEDCEVQTIGSITPKKVIFTKEQIDVKQPMVEQLSEQHATPEPCNNTTSPATTLAIVEENSNYSFSEFHPEIKEQIEVAGDEPQSSEEQTLTNSNSNEQRLADFIPLTVEPNVPDFLALPPLPPRPPRPQRPSLPIPEEVPLPHQRPAASPNVNTKSEPDESTEVAKEIESEAKVMLSKENAKLLLSAKGSEFLNDAGKQHNVRLSITFEAFGNVLLVTGTIEAQNQFHENLMRYLSDMKTLPTNETYFQTGIPKLTNKMAHYITEFFRLLVNEKESMRALLTKFDEASSPAVREKRRRKLNILLFGVYGLRDGRKHLNILRSQLDHCTKASEWQVVLTEHQRQIINESIRYIFTGYDHKDYAVLVDEFESLQKAKKLKKVTFYDLHIPKPPNPTHYQKFIEKLNKPLKNKAKQMEQVVKKPRESKNTAAKKARLTWNQERQEAQQQQEQNNRSYQAYIHADDDMVPHQTNSNAEDFILNIMNSSDHRIDQNRLAQLDNCTRHVQQSNSLANESNNPQLDNSSRNVWQTFKQSNEQQFDNSTGQVHQSNWVASESNDQQFENPSHQVHQSNWLPNESNGQLPVSQHSNDWFQHDLNRWATFGSAPKTDRFHWVRQQPCDAGPGGQPAASTSDVARLAEREYTLREQELSQLQRLQNLLR
uniref:Zinc finger CCHC domain-containing protein 7 n=1 Tax=Anopheles christyi TaxID=43041 RepID=A0A182JPT8_9DIPT